MHIVLGTPRQDFGRYVSLSWTRRGNGTTACVPIHEYLSSKHDDGWLLLLLLLLHPAVFELLLLLHVRLSLVMVNSKLLLSLCLCVLGV